MSDTHVIDVVVTYKQIRMHVAVSSGSHSSYLANSTLHLRNLDCYAVIRDFRCRKSYLQQLPNRVQTKPEIRF